MAAFTHCLCFSTPANLEPPPGSRFHFPFNQGQEMPMAKTGLDALPHPEGSILVLIGT